MVLNMSVNGTAMNPTTNPRMVNGVLIFLMMISNICGNGLVYYVYTYYFKRNIFTFFVKVLAALDLLTVTTMLMDVMVKVRPLDEDKLNLVVMCKVSHFAVYSSHLVCVCVLTLISYQRYIKVCHPLKLGLDLRKAKLITLFAAACCTAFCTFTLVIMAPRDVQVKVQAGSVVNVTICRYEEKYDRKPIQKAFNYILFAIFLAALASMFTFYILIARELRSFEKRNSDVFMSVPTTPEALSAHSQRHHSYLDKASVLSTRLMHGDKISTHMYKVFAIITLIFILSYLPHLIVLIVQEVFNLDHEILTYGERLVLELAYNSPYISSVANPIVYGFSNAEFRGHCRDLLTCKIWRGGSSFYG